jgi:hypothetical protein
MLLAEHSHKLVRLQTSSALAAGAYDTLEYHRKGDRTLAFN